MTQHKQPEELEEIYADDEAFFALERLLREAAKIMDDYIDIPAPAPAPAPKELPELNATLFPDGGYGGARKFHMPAEDLHKWVWKLPLTRLGEKLGVSDNAVRKRCRKHGIDTPPRGYWNKLNAGQTHEEALKGLGYKDVGSDGKVELEKL